MLLLCPPPALQFPEQYVCAVIRQMVMSISEEIIDGSFQGNVPGGLYMVRRQKGELFSGVSLVSGFKITISVSSSMWCSTILFAQTAPETLMPAAWPV